MYQLSHKTPENQVKNSKSLTSFKELYECLTKFEKKIFNLIIDLIKRYPLVCPSREWIADQLKIASKTVGRAIKKFRLLGILVVKKRDIKETCVYSRPDWMHKKLFKKIYKFLFSSRLKFNVKFPSIKIDKPFQEENVPQFNIFKIYNYKTLRKCISKTTSFPLGFFKKIGECMREEFVLMTKSLKNIDLHLNLTMHGKIKLRAFTDEALDFALSKLRSSPWVTKKFYFLKNRAIEFSEKNNIEIDWKRYFELKKVYQIPKDDNFYVNQKESLKGEILAMKQKENPTQAKYDPVRERMGKIASQIDLRRKEEFEYKNKAYAKEVLDQVRRGLIDEDEARRIIESRLMNL